MMKVKEIQEMLENENWQTRVAALYACRGRHDIPISFIEKGMDDEDVDVREVARRLKESLSI